MTRMFAGKMDLEDLLIQMQQINKLGSLGSIAKMIPGAAKMDDNKIDEASAKIRV
jgi:signal recognition particle subunit SRP54